MGNTATAGSTAASNAGTTLMQNFETELNRGPSTFNESLYAGAPGTLAASQAGAPALRQAQDWNSGVISRGGFNGTQRGAMGALTDVMNESSGQNAPGYQAMRQGVADTTLNDVNDMFSASGRFGGGGHVRTATDQLATNLGGLDYQNYGDSLARRAGAASSLFNMGQTGTANAGAAAAAAPGLYEAGLRPGQIADTDAQAALMGRHDLWDRTTNGNTDRLAQFMGMLQGANGMAGTQAETPWWQTALGIGATGAGIFGNFASGANDMGWGG